MIATAAFILQLAALAVIISFQMLSKKRTEMISPFLLLASAGLLLTEFALRSMAIRFPAITNTFESLIFFSAVIMILTFIYRIIAGKKAMQTLVTGITVVSIALLAIASSPLASREIQPPIPALQSGWLVLHVSFSFIGEAFFAVAFVSSIYFLASRNNEKKKALNKLTYTAIAMGYPIFTVGALLFGAIWASYSWGRFWGWDPKEVWALITWLTYTLYLHSRFVKKLSGRFLAWVSIIGFLFTLFTFFGVNFLLSGLHSYN